MTARREPSSTWGIDPKVRRKVRAFVLEMRKVLEEDLTRQLASMGVTASAIRDPARSLDAHEERLREAVTAVIERMASGKTPQGEAFQDFVRESAFTLLNRLVGLRVLEERNMLLVEGRRETVVRREPELRTSSLYFRVQGELPDTAAPREVWGEALDRAFHGVSERVGLLFDPDSEYGRYLPLQPTLTKAVDGLNSPEVPPETYAEDELLGWVYQYYNAEEKASVYAKLGKGGKVERPEEIAAATCLYTERYMVDFLLQNTLGALWVRMRPETKLPEAWPYYVTPPEAQPEPVDEQLPQRVRDISVLDPGVGSGHFLMRAFDLLLQMYREEGIEKPEDIPVLILERNLYGIDIDSRAIQITALGLYLKGCSLGGPEFRPKRLNLVSTNVSLPGAIPQSLLDRYAPEPDIAELMKVLWSELKDAPKLGALLHPERKVDELLARRIKTGDTLLHQGSGPEDVKLQILEGLREEFEKEAASADIAQRLFGANLERSLSLVEALTRRYDVVVMNPPYAGSKNLDSAVSEHISHEYVEGKRDLYAAFILRCEEFVKSSGRVGMVTQQSWMFLAAFSKLRNKILTVTRVTTVAHLGEHGFEESAAAGAFVALFTLQRAQGGNRHRWNAFRLIGPKTPAEKERLLAKAIAGKLHGIQHEPEQAKLLALPDAPFAYWLSDRFLSLLTSSRPLKGSVQGGSGLGTRDDERFLRFFWEVADFRSKWFPYSKGGGFARWWGQNALVVNYEDNGKEIRDHITKRFPYLKGNVGILIRQTELYFSEGLTYSDVARGALSCRLLPEGAIFSDKGPGLFPPSDRLYEYLAFLNSRFHSYLLRALSPTIEFPLGYVLSLPDLPAAKEAQFNLEELATLALELKRMLVAQTPTEMSFFDTPWDTARWMSAGAALLSSVEAAVDTAVTEVLELSDADVALAIEEVGMPAGWYPGLRGYLDPPDIAEAVSGSSQFAESVIDSIEAGTQDPSDLKVRISKLLHGTAPSASDTASDAGAHMPIPNQTFLEQISHTLRVHPISVHNLLKELHEQDGLVPRPQMREVVEDYASVSLLRVSGYRWPQQDAYEAEQGPLVPPELVDADGIIPLVRCTDEPTAVERIRQRIEHEFGEEGGHNCEREFGKWAGKDLEQWLEKDFFKRHISQFKKRPIAWHLTSPEGTFQTFVLYHRLSRETLRRIRDIYAGGLIKRLRAEQERARGRADNAAARGYEAQIEDVEEFSERLRAIEEGSELDACIRCRWKGEEEEGRPGPYAPDIDDGVKVNIRPFQEMGLLAKKVISKW